MPTAADVRQQILAAFPGDHVDVVDYTGTGDHFRAEIVSERFEGLSRIEQHKLVYAAVKDGLADGSIHALSLKTSVPAPPA